MFDIYSFNASSISILILFNALVFAYICFKDNFAQGCLLLIFFLCITNRVSLYKLIPWTPSNTPSIAESWKVYKSYRLIYYILHRPFIHLSKMLWTSHSHSLHTVRRTIRHLLSHSLRIFDLFSYLFSSLLNQREYTYITLGDYLSTKLKILNRGI